MVIKQRPFNCHQMQAWPNGKRSMRSQYDPRVWESEWWSGAVVLFESPLLDEQNPLFPKTQTLGGCETRCSHLSLPFSLRVSLFFSLKPQYSNSGILGFNTSEAKELGDLSICWVMATVAPPADRILSTFRHLGILCFEFSCLVLFRSVFVRLVFDRTEISVVMLTCLAV